MFQQPNAIPDNAQVQILDPTTSISISLIITRPLSPEGLSVEDHAAGIIAETHNVLTREEFASTFGANQDHIDAVVSFANQIGASVDLAHATAAIVSITGTAGLFNSTFGIELHTITANEISYISYSGTVTIPSELSGIVIGVDGLDYSYAPIPRKSIEAIRTDNNGVSPSSIFGVYNTPIGSPQAAATAYNFPGRNNGTDGIGQVVGLIEPFGNSGWTTANLNSTFINTYGLAVPTVVPYSINAPGTGADLEVMLDIAAVGGIVPKATIVVYIGLSVYTLLNQAIYDTSNLGYFPKVLSCSFASTIAQDVGLFAAATVHGITIVAGSGDWGPYNQPAGYTRSVDVGWPAADPTGRAWGTARACARAARRSAGRRSRARPR